VWLNAPLMPWLDPGPVPRHADWLEHVQLPQTEAELMALRRSVERGALYGCSNWVERQGNRILSPRKSGEDLQQSLVIPAGDQALAA
jgi:hypothetical protein